MTDPVWEVSAGLTAYPEALARMQGLAAGIRAGSESERIWLVEHPPLYTAGTSAIPAELIDPERFPVFSAGRGGRYTYHGPGQRVVYVMLDLAARGRDVRRYVAGLEHWLIDVLGDFGVSGRIIAGKVGVWVDTPNGTAKIAAIGVRVQRWVSFHGLSLNVAPELNDFNGIIPCGLAEPVTSLSALGVEATMADVDRAFARHMPALLARLVA
ncbi:lipoyl(octanoyl) transferase LipB [Sandarakinorhabdus oryzae]|uniref:lipoyl(octanoyl) transferase LipB n=1 Tax=Sandarakinorhabdus oryzae TaxID=2675220 RepID=UPI0012E2F243|nr:lipoyl(octanoyl) transferase LipB [Sandarakinorhabdus oryzae]